MQGQKSILRWGLVGGVVGAIGLAASASQAQVTVYSGHGLNLSIGVTSAAYFGTTRNTNFGEGRGFFNGGITDSSNTEVQYEEGYVQPSAYLTYDTPAVGTLGIPDGQLYITGSLIASATRGDGDPAGFTPDHPEDIDGEDFVVGWKGQFAGVDVDGSIGKQEFHVGTDFILGIGHVDSGNDGTFWLAPRYSFERVGLLKLDNVGLDNLMIEGFYIESDQTEFLTDFAGVNTEYSYEGIGTIGFMYFNILKSGSDTFVANADHRDGLDVFDYRASGNPLASQMPNWHFAFEYTTQNSNEGGGKAKVDADAWYLDVGYTFADTPWTPDLTYRFAHFSGDDPNTAEDEAYDPLYYGFTGWSTWFIGEVAGEYLLFNTNFDVNMVMASAQPYDNLALKLMFLDFNINEPGDANNASDPTADDDFGQEVDFIADWTVNDNMSISGVWAALDPGGNAERLAGGNNNVFQVIEAAAWVYF